MTDCGVSGVIKTTDPPVHRPIQADDTANNLFRPFPKATIDTPERLSCLLVPKSVAPVVMFKRDAESFFHQWGIPVQLSRLLFRKGLVVHESLAWQAAPPETRATDHVARVQDCSFPRPGVPTGNEYREGEKVWRRPALACLPMGFGGSVCIAQGLQDTFTSSARMPESCRLHPHLLPPGKLPIWSSIIDDVGAVCGLRQGDRVEGWLRRYDRETAAGGLRMSAKKNRDGVAGEEMQGLSMRSDRQGETWHGVSDVKRAKMMMANMGLLGTYAPLCRCVQRMVGKYQHASLVLRHPLSILESNFYSEAERKQGRLPWSSQRWEEFLEASLAIPLRALNLTSEFDTMLVAPDASSYGLGVSEARLDDPGVIQELARNSVSKGDYSTLDSGIPGLAAWDSSQPIRLKALKIRTDRLRGSHVVRRMGPWTLGALGRGLFSY